jgi:hypothetical protein
LAIDDDLDTILSRYQKALSAKTYAIETDIHDALMNVFGISALQKRQNRQYWGRELGMC